MFVRIGKYPNHHKRRPRQEVVRIHKFDGWSLDVTLAKVIGPALEAFCKDVYGYPQEFVDAGESEAWIATIKKMQKAFDMIANDYDMELIDATVAKDPHFGDIGNLSRNPELMEEYLRLKEAADAEIQEGLNLFAKYFRNLWN